MTAIIKNNFRLQNAKDFLEHFTNFGSTQTLQKNVTTTSGSDTITCIDTSDLIIGAEITAGANIPTTGSPLPVKITEIFSPTQFKINRNATASGSSTLTFVQLTRNHYFFIGKPTPWGGRTLELNPPAPGDSSFQDQRVWDEILSLKKIDVGNISLVIPRSNWDESGNTIYAIYDDRDQDLYRQPTTARQNQFFNLVPPRTAGNFYVINDEFDIFICLNNNRNSPSTIKPRRPSTITDLINYSDGYTWKFVASVKPSDQQKYVTDSWIPVKTILSQPAISDFERNQWDIQQDVKPGQVVSVVADSTGNGYTPYISALSTNSNPSLQGGFVTGTITNTGVWLSQSAGLAVLKPNDINGSSRSTVVDAYKNCALYITSGADIGSIYLIGSYNKDNGQILLKTPWSTYTSGPNSGQIKVLPTDSCEILPEVNVISNTNPSFPVKIKPTVVNGQITGATILSPGRNITSAEIVGADNSPEISRPGSGAGAKLRVVLSGPMGIGKDIEKDLGASYVMLNSRLNYFEGSGDFPIQNDYRQIGIIRNARNFDGSMATANTLIATKKLNLTGIQNNPLIFDEIVQSTVSGTSVKAIVIDYIPDPNIPNTGTITYIQNPETGYGAFTGGSTISGTSSQSTPFSATISGVINEEVKKLLGDIIYLENRRAILRAPDQIEDIKTVIEF